MISKYISQQLVVLFFLTMQIKVIKKDFLELEEELIVPFSSSRTYNFCVHAVLHGCLYVCIYRFHWQT